MRTTRFILAIFLLAFSAIPLKSWAQVPARSQQFEDAMARGIAMTQQKQWRLAIKYFRRAHKDVPTDPAVLLNLGLAFDKAGGRELIAAAWFKAFLATAPNAVNAGAIQKRVIELDTQAEIQVQKILDTMTSFEVQLPANTNKVPYFDLLAQINALAGNLSKAQQVQARTGKTAKKVWAPAYIASAQAHAGNFSAAKQSAMNLKWRRAKSWALADIAVIQASKKDIPGALSTAANIRAKHESAWALSRIAALQARAGDVSGAQSTLKKINENRIAHHALAQVAVAEGLAKTGDTENATKLIVQTQAVVGKIKKFQDRLNVLMQIVRAQAALKNFNLAESSAKTIPESHQKYAAYRAIAEAKGDITAAEVYRWTSLAIRAENHPNIGDIGSLLKSAKGKAIMDSIAALAKAAGARARLLRAFRNPN